MAWWYGFIEANARNPGRIRVENTPSYQFADAANILCPSTPSPCELMMDSPITPLVQHEIHLTVSANGCLIKDNAFAFKICTQNIIYASLQWFYTIS